MAKQFNDSRNEYTVIVFWGMLFGLSFEQTILVIGNVLWA